MLRKCRAISLLMAILFSTGVLKDAAAISDGYILSGVGMRTELLDKDCKAVFTWKHSITCGYSCYLLESGNLLRGCVPTNVMSQVSPTAAPQQGMIEEIDSSGKQLWSYTLATKTLMMHHDFKMLPNGNIIGVAFVNLLKADAIAAGVDSSVFATGSTPGGSTPGGGGLGAVGDIKSIESEMIFELKPDRTGGKNHQIVWEWHVLDHVAPKDQVAAHPELFDGTHPTWVKFNSQWFHVNGIDINASKNLIVFSSRVFSEVFVIDHSTTTEQAGGHTGGAYGKGGDILYRWGCPANFRATGGTTVNCMHCPTWIPEGFPGAGHIMFYHNNVDPAMKQLGFSQVIEINPWDASGKLQTIIAGTATFPATPTWIYKPDSMYSASMSTALRKKNGNTIIHEAYPGGNKSGNSSAVREVTPSGELVGDIKVINESGAYNSPKIMYYANDYPGVVKLLGPVAAQEKDTYARGAAAHQPAITTRGGRIDFSNVTNADITLFSLQGKRVFSLHAQRSTARIDAAQVAPGSYLARVKMAGGVVVSRLLTVER